MTQFPIGDWSNFFVAEVGAAAALTGLVIVAISINLTRILQFAVLPGRAAEALFTLAGAMVLASAGLVPNQSEWVFGLETLAVGLVMFLAPVIIQVRSLRPIEHVPIWRQYIRVVLTASASLLVIVAGIALMLGHDSGLYLIAAAIMLSLLVGLFSAWVLLVEILR